MQSSAQPPVLIDNNVLIWTAFGSWLARCIAAALKIRSLNGRLNKSITSSCFQSCLIFMDKLLQQKLNELKEKNLFRTPKGEWSEGFVNFSSNDYLSLSKHPEVIEAGVAAAEMYGAGAGASRVVGGNHPLFAEFEKTIAVHKGYEAATVFGSGYLANLGVIAALEPEVIYADRLVHACIIDGAQLSGAKLVRYKHNDVADLKRRVEKKGIIITEEIFSMDGDIAPLGLLKELKMPVMADGAHSLYQKSKPKIDIYIGTMSKALGSYGGYVCGSKTFIEYINTKARSLIYSTALPPFAMGAAIKALEIAQREKPYEKTLENVKYLCAKLGLNAGESAIVPIIIGDEAKAMKAEAELKKNKIIVSAIRPPTVPKGTSRLRISITAAHKKSEIDLLAETLKRVL